MLGFALPVGLLIYGNLADVKQPSISHYYYTQAGDFFVGALIGIAIFLVTYKGYDEAGLLPWWAPGDRVMSLTAAAGAFGTAIFPTYPIANLSLCGIQQLANSAMKCAIIPDTQSLVTGLLGQWQDLHTAAAAVFLAPLAYFCLVLFPLGPRGDPARRIELLTYYICGALIVICLAILLTFGDAALMPDSRTIFWAETIAIWSFSISWLINGEVLADVPGFKTE